MKKKFKELSSKLPAEVLKQANIKANHMLAEMLLGDVRKNAGLTQEELARSLNIKQPSLSKLEKQQDMQVSTLSKIIEALGGTLEIIAHMPKGDLKISQFRKSQVV